MDWAYTKNISQEDVFESGARVRVGHITPQDHIGIPKGKTK